MATFSLRLNTDNAAFEDSGRDEVARILRQLADDVAQYATLADFRSTVLHDLNGNRVGHCTFEKDL